MSTPRPSMKLLVESGIVPRAPNQRPLTWNSLSPKLSRNFSLRNGMHFSYRVSFVWFKWRGIRLRLRDTPTSSIMKGICLRGFPHPSRGIFLPGGHHSPGIILKEPGTRPDLRGSPISEDQRRHGGAEKNWRSVTHGTSLEY
ncbi:unnamed protein product [Nezara viridula]|uniref:Uncharacterized protein n=1 Tax=Nezara viridula TaxID=85310 RepID=A0A9P0HMQ4_NEZVI|nr:unnamed protein product [Nezara viridula]